MLLLRVWFYFCHHFLYLNSQCFHLNDILWLSNTLNRLNELKQIILCFHSSYICALEVKANRTVLRENFAVNKPLRKWQWSTLYVFTIIRKHYIFNNQVTQEVQNRVSGRERKWRTMTRDPHADTSSV